MSKLLAKYLTLSFLLLFLIGCATRYQIPKSDAPHAILKVKLSFDTWGYYLGPHRDRLDNFFPGGYIDSATMKFSSNLYSVKVKADQTDLIPIKTFTIPLDEMGLTDLVGIANKSHPITRIFSTKLVANEEVSLCLWAGLHLKSEKTNFTTVTLKDSRESLGCHAVTKKFVPKEGKAYILDYISDDLDYCEAEIFLQEPKEGGGFELIPVDY